MNRPLDIMIETRDLRKKYGSTEALRGIDLSVYAGELFAYLGPNGAGKSTTIRILTGLTRMSAGSARLGGYDIEQEPISAKRQFGVVHQYINLDQELTVVENLDLHGQLFGMDRRKRKNRTDVLLDCFDLGSKADSLIKRLSGGMKRRVTIARALMHEPAILFLDEPTVGLDAAIRRRIWAMIKKIQQQGTTIFLTTHHIEEAEFLADRVAFLDQGRIVAMDTPLRLMQGIGTWAIDQVRDNEMQTTYFRSRDEADHFRAYGPFTLRRVNLEDAFLQLTGKKVGKDGRA